MKTSVLVVDDDDMIISIAQRMLPHDRFDVVVAQGGREAIEKIAQMDFDVMVTDVDMPDLNGYALATEVLKGPARTAIVMMTGVPTTKLQTFAAARNIIFITKPFRTKDLIEAVESQLARQGPRNE